MTGSGQNSNTDTVSDEVASNQLAQHSLDIGPFWELRSGPGPLLGIALHAGHNLRSEIVPLIALTEEQRFREEDPYSDYWTLVCGSQLLTLRSRFEVDLNRPRDEAVYKTNKDAWGLNIWREPPDSTVINVSLSEHDHFYRMLEHELTRYVDQYGYFVVLDFHSYNHRRGGPTAPFADPSLHPEINIGTGTLDRERWVGVVEGFMEAVRDFQFFWSTPRYQGKCQFSGPLPG